MRAQLPLVKLAVEEDEVRHELHRLLLAPELYGRGDALEQLQRLPRARHLHDARAAGGEEEGIERVEGQQPAQAGRRLLSRQVEWHALPERPVELGA